MTSAGSIEAPIWYPLGVEVIRTLIADDSPTARNFLLKTLEGQDDIEVVGLAANGLEAVEMAARLRPTVITMDLWMPELDGLAATERIMTDCPTRIVIVSSGVDSGQSPASSAQADQRATFDALQAGALEVFPKARSTDGPALERYRARLLSTLRAMAGVTVLRRRRGVGGLYLRPVAGPAGEIREGSLPLPSRASLPPLGVPKPAPAAAAAPRRFVAVGASTGGPPVLAQLLAALPREAPPIAVVQHMAPGFTDGFLRWLRDQTGLAVKLAVGGEAAAGATVYVAPEGLHLRLAEDWTFRLAPSAGESQFCPSVDVLFQSVAAVAGRSGIGLLLTGMGEDGARGLLELRRAGGLALAQDGESCVVNGMPAAAAELGAVERFVRPSLMPTVLASALTGPTGG